MAGITVVAPQAPAHCSLRESRAALKLAVRALTATIPVLAAVPAGADDPPHYRFKTGSARPWDCRGARPVGCDFG
ncbi:MAG TPA: hypothetical protein VHS97_25145, partial [Isosphaeraceae bacterium]|nr:hypothetical protein [Isosphaeraceae bacterium]